MSTPHERMAHSLADTQQARDAWELTVARATEFARLAGVEVEEWMIWGGWVLHVGCEICADQGRDAPCWGRKDEHGYENGCGCSECAARQIRELNEAEAKS